MHIIRTLAASFLISTVVAVKPAPSRDTFQQFHSNTQPLKLDDYTYSKLTAVPRDYSVAVLLTAMDTKFGCRLCHDFDPEWNLLSKSWTKGDTQGDSRLIFGTLDFMQGRNTFQSLGLKNAPVLMLFQPTQGLHAASDSSPIKLEFTTGLLSAEQIHSWIARHLQGRPHPPIQRPVNWSHVAYVMSAIFGIFAISSVMGPYIVPIIQNRKIWAAISLIIILLFTSGHMFNHIRKVPYVTGNGKGGISYFAGGFASQFGIETQIIAILYGTLSIATISLALRVPQISDPKVQQIAVLAWSCLVFFAYSFLLSIFRVKNGAYPFWFPPFP